MRNNNVFSTLIAVWVGVPSMMLFLCASSAGAQIGSTNYTFVVASGFLCDPGDSGSCPAVAKSPNGDSYEISGAGTFNPQNRSVKATGTFNHKSTNGNVVEVGVWTASDLISFDSYGRAPAVLMQKGPALGRPRTGPKGQMPTGGLAIFRIFLMAMSGPTKSAVLQVNCTLGAVPRERSVEGIRITVERNNSEYSGEASGRVMFLAQRPEVRMPAKMPEQETRPEALGQLQK